MPAADKITARELGFPDFNALVTAADEIPFEGQITSRQVEEALSARFNILGEQRRRLMEGRSTTKWANYIHFVLVALQKRQMWENIGTGKADDGGQISIYRRVDKVERRATESEQKKLTEAPEIPREHNDVRNDIDQIMEEGCFFSKDALSRIMNVWRNKKNIVLQGPPGTGKTWLAKRLGFALVGSNDRETSRSRLRVVQFHPSLAYEDFVRGWRPNGDGRLTLADGILIQAIEAAASEPERPFVLVIEEINRGNPAQIFGEMLTLLESTKRRPSEAIELAYRKAPGERVHVPANLYVIGTMNVADRSLAIVDLALRRRFAFIDLEPQLNGAWRVWCTKRGIDDSVCSEISARIDELNAEISAAVSLGPQFRIGHSYVTPDMDETVQDGRAWFRSKVETEIGPLLDEYWYDAPDKARDAKDRLLSGLS